MLNDISDILDKKFIQKRQRERKLKRNVNNVEPIECKEVLKCTLIERLRFSTS